MLRKLETGFGSANSTPFSIMRHRGKRPASGQSLVEVALVTPLLLALLIGAVEMGRFAYLGILVGNAARAGAAYGTQSLPLSVDSTGICDAASLDFEGDTAACGAGGQITVTSSTSCGCDNGGTITAAACTGTKTAGTCTAGGNWVVMVTVNASGTFQSLFGFPGIPGSVTISRSSTMRVAQR
jgi:Flp pilus assembly protein TadG